MFSKANYDAFQTSCRHAPVRLLLRAMLLALILGYGLTAFCDTEAELKANFIYTFAKSSDIPRDKFGEATAPYVIGVFGDADFVDVLRDVLAGKSINSHPLKIKHLASEGELGQCAFVYFHNSPHKRTADALHDAPSGTVLVGEGPSFLAEGGMIALLTEHGKVQFEVSKVALDKGNVRLDPKLLALAKGPNETSGTRKVRSNVKPEYPEIARKMAIKGIVQLKVKVSSEGAVRGVEIVGGNPILVEAAITAVKKWRFEASVKDSVELVKLEFD